MNDPKPIDVAAAKLCLKRNLITAPGWGSLRVGRVKDGIRQLLLSVTGGILFLTWFVKITSQYYGQIDGSVPVKPVNWIGIIGGVLFVAAWIWSLITGLDVLREAKQKEIEFLKRPLTTPNHEKTESR